jgi:hypothetical protein
MSPVVATTECIPRRKAKPSTGVIPKMKGIIRASVAPPPDTGQQAHRESQPHAQQHQREGFPLEDEEQTIDKGVNHGASFLMDKDIRTSLRDAVAGRHPPPP